jgi:hypothetical protein
MRHSVLLCCGNCLLTLAFARGAWGQTEPRPLGSSTHAFPYPVAAVRPSSRLEPASITSKAATQGSPYQQWRQVYAPQSGSANFSDAIYSPTRQGSHWIEEILEELPFQVEQGGISLGDNSPFFLHPNGLVYQRSY